MCVQHGHSPFLFPSLLKSIQFCESEFMYKMSDETQHFVQMINANVKELKSDWAGGL